MDYKGAIETREYFANGFSRLSGYGVQAVNVRERKTDVVADIIIFDYNDNKSERYNKCIYPKTALKKILEATRG